MCYFLYIFIPIEYFKNFNIIVYWGIDTCYTYFKMFIKLAPLIQWISSMNLSRAVSLKGYKCIPSSKRTHLALLLFLFTWPSIYTWHCMPSDTWTFHFFLFIFIFISFYLTWAVQIYPTIYPILESSSSLSTQNAYLQM